MVSTAPGSTAIVERAYEARRSISSTGARTRPYLIENALSPAKVVSVDADRGRRRSAAVVVPDYQLSLAIGKEGQNARLAAKADRLQDRYQE